MNMRAMNDELGSGLHAGLAAELPDLQDFRQVVEQAAVGICITQQGRLSYVNPHFAQMHGYAPEELLDADYLQIVHPDEALRVAEIRRQREAGLHSVAYESRNLRKDGSSLDIRIYGRSIVYRGQPAHLVTISDISEQAQARAQLERLENYHPVTGLANRALLLKRTEAAVTLAHQEGHPLALLYLRVPDLERVHDALGLQVGDALASTMAARIVGACSDGDIVADFGSGEFAILLDPCEGADAAAALQTATRVLAALSPPATIDDTELFAGGHVGIALLPADAATGSELLANAYAACGRGDTVIGFFTREASVDAARRIRLEAALRRAFGRNELSLHYQPQIDLRDGSIIGVEALLRWRCEEFGHVSPNEFVPIAEEIGLIVPMGEWVFRKACEQSVAWAAADLPPIRISVNLSPRQLEQNDISQRLQSVLLSTGADPTLMGVEVTEWVLMRDLDHARRALHELSALGVEIALDDFGTGYANLAMLRALPFDVLKIDRSLVRDATAAPEDVAIMRGVILLAQGLKVKVLAEGVETEGQANLLTSSGCELMQGYLFSPALPAEEIEVMLRNDHRMEDRYLRRDQKRRTLLLVDDEESMLSSLRRLLRGSDCQIVLARSGDEGLARLAEHDVDVIISDQRMPGMTGVEFLRRAKELYPDTVRIVLSGYTEVQAITDAINEGAIYKFLTKPWDDAQLRAHVAEAFRRKELADEHRRREEEVRNSHLGLEQLTCEQRRLLALQREQIDLATSRAAHAQALVEHLPAALIGLDDQDDIVFLNRQARSLIGDAEGLVGLAAEDALPAAWQTALEPGRAGEGRSVQIGDRRYRLTCTDAGGSAGGQGRLLCLVPEPMPTTAAAATSTTHTLTAAATAVDTQFASETIA